TSRGSVIFFVSRSCRRKTLNDRFWVEMKASRPSSPSAKVRAASHSRNRSTMPYLCSDRPSLGPGAWKWRRTTADARGQSSPRPAQPTMWPANRSSWVGPSRPIFQSGHLPRALDRYRPELVVYNAGSDVLWSDPLSHLFLTPQEMA